MLRDDKSAKKPKRRPTSLGAAWILLGLSLSSSAAGIETRGKQLEVPEIDAKAFEIITENHGEVKFLSRQKDFGRVYRGELLEHRFVFENRGDGPLLIQAVHSECGCATAEIDFNRIYQPGDQGSLLVKLDTTDYLGSLHKTVSVMTSDSRDTVTKLTLKAQIQTEVRVLPPIADFGGVQNSQGAHRRVFLQPTAFGRTDFEVQDLLYDENLVSAAFTDSGKDWVIDIYIHGFQRQSFLSTTLFVLNNSKHLPRLPIPIRADVLGNIHSEPRYLEFGAIAAQNQVEKTIKLRSVEQFKVLSYHSELHINGRRIERPDAFVEVMPSDSEFKKNNFFKVRLKNSNGAEGSVHGRLHIETSDMAQPEIVMDFYAFFGP